MNHGGASRRLCVNVCDSAIARNHTEFEHSEKPPKQKFSLLIFLCLLTRARSGCFIFLSFFYIDVVYILLSMPCVQCTHMNFAEAVSWLQAMNELTCQIKIEKKETNDFFFLHHSNCFRLCTIQ